MKKIGSARFWIYGQAQSCDFTVAGKAVLLEKQGVPCFFLKKNICLHRSMKYATMEADKKGGFPCAVHWNRTSILVHIFKKKTAYVNTKKNVRTNLFPLKKSHMFEKNDGTRNFTKNSILSRIYDSKKLRITRGFF